MSPRRRRSAVLDRPAGEAPSIEEAEAAALNAETRAEAARTRAADLRRQAAKASTADRLSRWRSRLPALFKGVGVGAVVVLFIASLAATVYMVLEHRSVLAEQQRAAEFSAAARQSIVTMMTIDPATIRQDVQRMIDNSVGEVRDALQEGAAATMVKGVEQSKVKTTVAVRSVAIESMTDDSAVVLVAATTEATNPDDTKLPAHTFRLSLTLISDDGQFKLSKLEFL